VGTRRSGTQKAPSGRAPSQRQLRVGEVLRTALAEILTRGSIRDPILQKAIITVSEVRASSDLKTATVYVIPLDHPDPTSVVDALTRAKKYIRGELARAVQMKHMPEIAFLPDTTFDYAQSVNEMLSSPEVARDLNLDDEDS